MELSKKTLQLCYGLLEEERQKEERYLEQKPDDEFMKQALEKTKKAMIEVFEASSKLTYGEKTGTEFSRGLQAELSGLTDETEQSIFKLLLTDGKTPEEALKMVKDGATLYPDIRTWYEANEHLLEEMRTELNMKPDEFVRFVIEGGLPEVRVIRDYFDTNRVVCLF